MPQDQIHKNRSERIRPKHNQAVANSQSRVSTKLCYRLEGVESSTNIILPSAEQPEKC